MSIMWGGHYTGGSLSGFDFVVLDFVRLYVCMSGYILSIHNWS